MRQKKGFSIWILTVTGLFFSLFPWAVNNALAGREIIPPPSVTLEKGQKEPKPMALVAPYAFKTETLDWTYGLAGGATGYIQKQFGFASAIMNTTNASYGLYLVGWNYRLPYTERLFIDGNFSHGNYKKNRFYVKGNPNFSGPRAGSNDSESGNYVESEGEDNWADLRFHYILPTGHAKEKAISRFELKNGLLSSSPSGSTVWNPFKSGISVVEAKLSMRKRSSEHKYLDASNRSNGLKLAFTYNNTDFPSNPALGSVQRIAFTRDPGWMDSTDTWTTVELEASKYFSFNSKRFFKQNVLAFDLWTIDTPTWEKDSILDTISHRPPPYLGANLGGFWRMRGYPSGRFNDKAAIYYCAEWRIIPQWQPLPKISWLDFFKIDWWQFVGFAEAGRVAENWSFDELHSDMKWDLGVGLRLMAIKSVVRLDMAYSDEGVGIWAMVGHPF